MRTFSTTFNRSGDSGYIFVPDAKEKIQSFYQIRCYLLVFHSCHFLARGSSVPNLLHGFFTKECCILSDTISAYVDMLVFIIFLPLIWYMTLIFWYIESIFHSWDKSHLVAKFGCQYLVEDLGIWIHQGFWSVVLFCDVFSFGNTHLTELS